MTQRSELRHRLLEAKVIAMNWVAGRLFTFKRTGVDGLIKKRLLPPRPEQHGQ